MLRLPDATPEPIDPPEAMRELLRLRSECRRLARLRTVQAELVAVCERELRGELARLGDGAALAEGQLPTVAARLREIASGMARSLDRLLDAGDLGAGALEVEPRECELGALLRSCHDALRPVAHAAGVGLELELPPDPLPALVDGERLRDGLLTLLFDAIDGAADDANEAHREVRLRGWEQADAVRIEVDSAVPPFADTSEAAERAGRWPARRPRQSAWSSLAALRELVERQGGRLSSTRTAGTARATLSLPCPHRALAEGRGRILLVEDEPQQAEVIASVLRRAGHDVEVTLDGDEGLERARQRPPELILLDVELPAMDGFTLAERLARDARTREVPRLFLSAHDETEARLRGLALACDYLPKPFQARELLARVGRALATAMAHERLRAQAWRDELTGLGNYRHLRERLAAAHAEATREDAPLALLLLDVDGFKRWNDEHGHSAGNALLATLGAALRDAVGQDATAARFGGDELVALLPRAGVAEAEQCARRVRERFAELQHERHGAAAVTLSIGVAVALGDAATGDALIDAADGALYRAKHRGGDTIEIAPPLTTGVDPPAPPGHEPELAAAGPPSAPPPSSSRERE